MHEGPHLPSFECRGSQGILPCDLHCGRAPMRILVLDNQTSHIDTLARGLRIKGYGVVAATNAGEALSLLRAGDSAIDLIITDDATVLPDSGELIRCIEECCRRPPVIMMTEGRASGHNINPLTRFCTTILEKPFDMAALAETVERSMHAPALERPATGKPLGG